MKKVVEEILRIIKQLRKLHADGFTGNRELSRGFVSKIQRIGGLEDDICADVRSHSLVRQIRFKPRYFEGPAFFIEMHEPITHSAEKVQTPEQAKHALEHAFGV